MEIEKFTIIAGPCVIESKEVLSEVAHVLKDLQEKYPDVRFVFKSSFDMKVIRQNQQQQ